jgi:hypothetical protein
VAMKGPTGEAASALGLNFDRRLLLQYRKSAITADVGLQAYGKLADTLRVTDRRRYACRQAPARMAAPLRAGLLAAPAGVRARAG